MRGFRNQDESMQDVLEQHNFYAASDQSNESAAIADLDQRDSPLESRKADPVDQYQ